MEAHQQRALIILSQQLKKAKRSHTTALCAQWKNGFLVFILGKMNILVSIEKDLLHGNNIWWFRLFLSDVVKIIFFGTDIILCWWVRPLFTRLLVQGDSLSHDKTTNCSSPFWNWANHNSFVERKYDLLGSKLAGNGD